jgi:hypothetical protein
VSPGPIYRSVWHRVRRGKLFYRLVGTRAAAPPVPGQLITDVSVLKQDAAGALEYSAVMKVRQWAPMEGTQIVQEIDYATSNCRAAYEDLTSEISIEELVEDWLAKEAGY